MRFLFKYPTFGRPEWFKSTLEEYYKMLSGCHEYEFIVSCNEDDKTMNNEEIKRYMASKPHLRFFFDFHQNKVAAINADMENVQFDVLFLISDDMIPIQPGFDLTIIEAMKEHFPEFDGALHFNDDCCGKDKCITLSIMGVGLYNYFGYIYHPGYKSFYCDNEFTDEAYRLGKAVYIPKVIVKHDWKGWGQGDAVYKRNTALGRGDEATYKRRKELGFPK